ncbi:MAG: hypothetical protein B6240_03855, partial [Desulfobacteraceae bacterium 4572_87]
MENSTAPRGLIVDLITPFKQGAIDESGLESLLERVVPHAQALLLASPRHGEGESQDFEDLNQDYPTNSVFWVDTPLRYHSNRGLPDYYRELLAQLKYPLILHNDPDCIHATRAFKRHNIRTAVLKELVRIDGIAGLIFSGSLERAHHYQRACRGRQNFRIYDGDEKRFLEHPSMGGVVSVGANLAPGTWEMITQSSIRLHAHRENYPDRLHHRNPGDVAVRYNRRRQHQI